jgi:hypothetical protein
MLRSLLSSRALHIGALIVSFVAKSGHVLHAPPPPASSRKNKANRQASLRRPDAAKCGLTGQSRQHQASCLALAVLAMRPGS